MTEALQAARPHHHETLVDQFHDEFVTPSELRDRVEGCLKARPSKTKGKTPHESEGTVTAAHLLPVKHAQYPAHALLKVDDVRILATPAQLLKLSDDDPRFGRLRERGLYAEWNPSNFMGRRLRYSYIIKVPVELNGGTFFVRSATRLYAPRAPVATVRRRRSRSPQKRRPRTAKERQNGCVDRSVGFLDAMRDASFNARRRRQRSVRRLLRSDDYDFAAQWRVASEFVEASGARVPHEALDWEAMDATDLL
jgi:hypothetical protein